MKSFSVLFVLLAVSSGALAQPWPSFRGANSAGIADDQDLPVEWNVETGRNLRWNHFFTPEARSTLAFVSNLVAGWARRKP